MIQVKSLFSFIIIIGFSCSAYAEKKYQQIPRSPASVEIGISNCETEKGNYSEGETIRLSVVLSNDGSSAVKIRSITARIMNLRSLDSSVSQATLSHDVVVKPRSFYSIENKKIWTVPSNTTKDPFGVYIEYILGNGDKSVSYETFFRVVDSTMLTTYQIEKYSYNKLPVFSLDGGMSAEYAVLKSGEALAVGISDSWKVNAHASGPNQVYATPQFLEKSVRQTVDFYNQQLGTQTQFETVIISTGIPSIPYLSQAMKAPVLPLHFLASANTVKEIRSVLEYSNRKGYFSYGTLGHDPSVPYVGVAWVKLLDIPKEYIDFIKQHRVKNVILMGATGAIGGETTARKVITSSLQEKGYHHGDLFILYPQGGGAGDSIAFSEKLIDIKETTLQPDLIRIADWESGIIPEQVTNFSQSIKRQTTVKNIQFITGHDDGDLYMLATYVSLAFMHKNNASFLGSSDGTLHGVSLNPYLISHPFYECRFGYIPFVYWQGNPQQSIIDKLERQVQSAIISYFPETNFKDLNFWINSSVNFGGPEKASSLKNALQLIGLKNFRQNDYSVDEVWDLKDGLNAPCETRAAELTKGYSVEFLKKWEEALLPLLPKDLSEISKRFPEIIVTQQ